LDSMQSAQSTRSGSNLGISKPNAGWAYSTKGMGELKTCGLRGDHDGVKDCGDAVKNTAHVLDKCGGSADPGGTYNCTYFEYECKYRFCLFNSALLPNTFR
jgi:hypothetical protein